MNWQLVIILIYFAITVVVGLMSAKKTKSAAAFTGTALTVFAIVCASTGEWLGGTATTGVSEYGFLYGLSGAWYTIANGIGVMFLGLVFAKLFRSLETGTVPGIIEKFFGVRARMVSSIVLTIVMLAVGLSQMIAAGKLGESLLNIPFVYSCIGFAVIFIIYTLAGGMNAVASTNTIHMFVMYFGIILAVVLALVKVGGISEVKEGLAAVSASDGESANFWNMFTIGGDKVSSWIIASLLGACTAQAGLQPVLASKNAHQARKACIITAFVVAPFGFLTAFLGMISRVLFEKGILLPGVQLSAAGKSALPELMMNMNPIAGGIVLAAILAAVLSTVSPIILASGTMLTRDIYQRVMKPGASDRDVLKMGRVTTAVSGVICCVGAIFLWKLSTVLELVYAAYSLRGALFVVVLLGIYWKRASEKAACLSMICTAVVALTWVSVKLFTGAYPLAIGSFAITETYAAILVAFVCTVLFSFVFPKKMIGARSSKPSHIVA